MLILPNFVALVQEQKYGNSDFVVSICAIAFENDSTFNRNGIETIIISNTKRDTS